MALRPNTILQRAPNLNVRIESNNEVFITGAQSINCGSYGLAVLDAFAHPTALSAALKKLEMRVSGGYEWMELTRVISYFFEQGILLDEHKVKPTLSESPVGFDAARIHVAMLNDEARTLKYLKAISETVCSQDVVLDIGTGTGVLALAAARAGARHVYAIEATSIAGVAQSLIDANGLADRITLVRGWSTQVDLPEHADVLVSEIIGTEPFGERVLEITGDAIKRLLKPDARLVPSGISLFGLPVTIPQIEIEKHRFTEDAVRNWESWYGFDFSPLSVARPRDAYEFSMKSAKLNDWKHLSEPVLLKEVDFTRCIDSACFESKGNFIASASGEMNGVALCFDLHLSPTTVLSTRPELTNKSNHWPIPLWLLPESLYLQQGNQVELSYSRTTSRTKMAARRTASQATSA